MFFFFLYRKLTKRKYTLIQAMKKINKIRLIFLFSFHDSMIDRQEQKLTVMLKIKVIYEVTSVSYITTFDQI